MRALGPGLLCLLVVAGCGTDFATVEPDNPSRVSDGLVLTRADGSSYEVKRAVARCGRTPVGADYLVLTAADTRAVPLVTAKVTSGLSGSWRLPLDTNSAATRDLVVRASDPVTGARFSALSNRAAGEVTVTEATCEPEPRLTLRIHATLLDQDHRPLKVEGSLASLTGE
ncbi:MAG: hypothetical protein ABWX73_03070 [Marmoricola sp.]